MIQRPRGTRDFGPEEMAKRRKIEQAMREVCHRFGFGEVVTPTFEHSELFTLRSGQGIVDEMYVFKDKGDREGGFQSRPYSELYFKSGSANNKSWGGVIL